MYSTPAAYDRKVTDRPVSQVGDPNGAWYAMMPHWILIEDLLGGTYGIRRKHALILLAWLLRQVAAMLTPDAIGAAH